MTAEKTEQPTQKKLSDARKKGQVAKSKEVSGTISFIIVISTLWFMSDEYINAIKEMVLLPSTVYNEPFLLAFKVVTLGILYKSVYLLLPLMLASILGSILGNTIQFGFLISGEPIKPDIKKINPVEGFKKIFCLKSFVEFLKSLIKIIFLSFVVYFIIKNDLQDLISLPHCGSKCILPVAGSMLKKLLIYTIASLIIIAVIDFLFEKQQFTKQNKMTKDEVKREYKENDGDPEVKSKRKEIHREIINEAENTKQSSVVIKNPTHLAIGLYYEQDSTPLPVVTVKGRNGRAQFIIKVAEQANIPILENVPLAHALFNTDVANHIPSDLIEPVAEIFRWLEDLKDQKELPQ